MKFRVYEGSDGQWYWHLHARNGRVVADGGEGHKNPRNAKRAIRKLCNQLHQHLCSIWTNADPVIEVLTAQ